MAQLLKTLPLLGLPLMWLCNIDAYVIPILRNYFSFLETTVIACFLATLELVYLYWIIGWVAVNVKEKTEAIIKEGVSKNPDEINEDLAMAKEVVADIKMELKRKGHIDRIKAAIRKYLDVEIYKSSPVFRVLNWGGSLAIFIIATIPEPGLRVIGTVFCRIINSRKTFVVLLVGNAIKTTGMVKFWEYLSGIPIWFRILSIVVFFVFFWVLGKVLIRYIKKDFD